MISFPWSAILAFVYIYALVLTYSLSQTHPGLKRLYSGKACAITIAVATVMAVIYGFIGFHRSPLYYIVMLAMLSSMGLRLIDDLWHIKQRKPAMTLAHLSVSIALFAGLFGSGDKRSANLEAHIGEPVSQALGSSGKTVRLPFTLTLDSFTIDQYPAKLMISGEGADDWNLTVLESYDMAMPAGEGFRELKHTGAEPAAFVRAENAAAGKSVEGWVSCGSFMFDAVSLPLPDGREVYMPRPMPKKYESKVRAVDDKGREYHFEIAVNHPVRIGKWRIYQADYDSSRGRWSTLSVFQCVYDPWYPIIAAGLWMVLAAALLMFATEGIGAFLAFLRRRRLPSTLLSASCAAVLLAFIGLLWNSFHGRTLMPALQSPWFVPHVAVYMFAYAILGAVTLYAAYLWVRERRKPAAGEEMRRCDILVRVGWAFLSLGMVMGALWAKQAWGDWWSWDPKETWALATWLGYLFYMHARPRARSMYALLIVCFLMLCMCWLGVNYLPSAKALSIHVY